jgi:hypothetical protein
LIPYYYAWAYYALAVAAENRGEAELADRYFVAGEDWMELVLVRE